MIREEELFDNCDSCNEYSKHFKCAVCGEIACWECNKYVCDNCEIIVCGSCAYGNDEIICQNCHDE